MEKIALGFAFAVLVFQQLKQIPPLWALLLPLPLLFFWYKRTGWKAVYAVLLGFLWSHVFALVTEPPLLPDELLGSRVWATGVVTGIPQIGLGQTKFLFSADLLQTEQHSLTGNWRFRVSWYDDAPHLASGDHWRLQLKLKQAHGFLNPGGFDYQGWLYHQGVRYTAYVTSAAYSKPGQSPTLDYLRQRVSEKLSATVSDGRGAAILKALVVGDRSGLAQADRNLFAATGISHLMAISGLHVGLVAGMSFFLTQYLWRRWPLLCRRLPAQLGAAPPALVAAAAYAAMAGFSVPTQRALLMVLVALGGILLCRRVRVSQTLSVALLAVLVHYPPGIVSAGFWLSFLAVAVILYSSPKNGRSASRSYNWLRLQFAVALGLAPVLLVYQMGVPIIAPLVNLVAIPLFSFIVVPAALAGTVLLACWPSLGELMLNLASQVILVFLSGLDWFAQFSPPAISVAAVSIMAVALGLVGIVLLLAPQGVPGRYLGVFLILPMLLPQERRSLAQGEFHFTLLDVGQGLSAVVETANHVLVYDAGPRYRSGFETGSAVVVPFLRSVGYDGLDLLLVSHSDVDHAGGAEAITRQLDVGAVLSGEAGELGEPLAAVSCEAGQYWTWDDVSFEVLHPDVAGGYQGNNASCVLRVSNSVDSLLLTGDIEKNAEKRLLETQREKLKSTVVVAPHHGSRSSSGEPFVEVSAPDMVLFATGFANRWGFPVREIRERWENAGSRIFDTAYTGAIQLRFTRTGVAKPLLYRESDGRYWNR